MIEKCQSLSSLQGSKKHDDIKVIVGANQEHPLLSRIQELVLSKSS
jgi:hypothetical protein